MKDLENIFSSIQDLCDELNIETSSFLGSSVVFTTKISVEVTFRDPELTFNQLVSWLYILFFESSGKNFDFIRKKNLAEQGSFNPDAFRITRQIHAFRTYLQHNLHIADSVPDREKFYEVQSWFLEKMHLNNPADENDWKVCIEFLLNDVVDYLTLILACLKKFKSNEHADIIQSDWQRIIDRGYGVYDFVQVLQNVLDAMNLNEFIDAHEMTKKYIGKWREDLLLAPDGFVFSEVAATIVQKTVLSKDYLPVNGGDIIALGIPKGPEILRWLVMAKGMFYDKPCSKAELLDRLAIEMKV